MFLFWNEQVIDVVFVGPSYLTHGFWWDPHISVCKTGVYVPQAVFLAASSLKTNLQLPRRGGHGCWSRGHRGRVKCPNVPRLYRAP